MRMLIPLAAVLALAAGAALAAEPRSLRFEISHDLDGTETRLSITDLDGDGLISTAELQAQASNDLAGRLARRFFARLDKDASGSVTIDELDLPPTSRRAVLPGSISEARITTTKDLSATDADRDGSVSLDEFSNQAPESMRRLLAAGFANADIDKDGQLSELEWAAVRVED